VNQGTPDQNKQIRRRRRVIHIFSPLFVLFGAISAVFVNNRYGEHAGLACFMFFWLFGFCGYAIFTLT
jgi:hypothetical protein